MIQMHCNCCDKIINRVKDRWIGADVVEVDDEDADPPADDVVDGEYRFHFCSEACMSSWAFGANFGETTDAAAPAAKKSDGDG